MHKVSLLAASWTVYVYAGDRERNSAFRDFTTSVFVNVKFPMDTPLSPAKCSFRDNNFLSRLHANLLIVEHPYRRGRALLSAEVKH